VARHQKSLPDSHNDLKSFEEQVREMHDNECVAYMGPDRPIMQHAGELLSEALKDALRASHQPV